MRLSILLSACLVLSLITKASAQRTRRAPRDLPRAAAQSEKSVLSRTPVTPRPTTRQQQDQFDAGVKLKIDAIQQKLAREERYLHSRLAKLDKMRKGALEKRDDQLMKKIEQLEQQAVQNYQQKIEQLISNATLQSNQSPNARSRSSPNSRKKQSQSRQPSFRLWPFGRN